MSENLEGVPKSSVAIDHALLAADRVPNWIHSGYLSATTIFNLDVPVRYAAMGATLAATGNPVAAGLVMGGATLANEALSTLSGVSLIESDTGKKTVTKLNSLLDRYVDGDISEQQLHPLLKAGLAMSLGSPALVLAEKTLDTDMDKEEQVRVGLRSSRNLAAYFTAESIAFGQAAQEIGVAKAIGGGALALAAGYYGLNKLSTADSRRRKNSAEEYEAFHDDYDRYLRVGVFGEDLKRVIDDPRTIFRTKGLTRKKTPVLAPIDLLEWFNADLMRERYGDDADEVYVYLHPPVISEKDHRQTSELIEKALSEGKIVLTEVYSDDSDSPIRNLVDVAQADSTFEVESFGDDSLPAGVNFFNCPIKFNGVEQVRQAESALEVYDRLIREGKISVDDRNGPALVPVIEGEEAEEIWSLYKKPFDDLGKNDPTLAGFDKASLMEILSNPEAVKVVNRVDGRITTLVIFDNDFERVPWFNASKYREDYPELFDTKNIIFFPGIVTDERMRGNDYAQKVLDLAIRIYAERGTNVMMGFECTQISSQYIPAITKAVFKASGLAEVEGTDEPAGSIEYYAIRKR